MLKKVYVCNRCETQIKRENRMSLYTCFPKRTPRKKWDLCDKCYRALVRGIEKIKE